MVSLLSVKASKTTAIGLDVGHTAVRLAQLHRQGDGWRVAGLTTWPVTGAQDAAQVLTAIESPLSRSLRQKDFIGRDLVVGLSPPDIELYAVELPDSKENRRADQLAAAVRWEIERLSPLGEGAAETAHWWLPKGRGGQHLAIGVAAAKTMIAQAWQACRRAGAECQRIDAIACALVRAGLLLRQAGSNEVWGVLDVGAQAVRLVLCVDQVPVVVRSIDGGSQQWTEHIAAALKVSEESAEQHKCDHGICPPGRGGQQLRCVDEPAAGEGPIQQLGGMIFTALFPLLERITGEIKRSYEYVLQTYPGHEAADLMLVGAGGRDAEPRYLPQRPLGHRRGTSLALCVARSRPSGGRAAPAAVS